MKQPDVTDEEFRKSLQADAHALWQLYLGTLAIDAKLAGLIKTRADAALDRWNEFSMLSIRHENELSRIKLKELNESLHRIRACDTLFKLF